MKHIGNLCISVVLLLMASCAETRDFHGAVIDFKETEAAGKQELKEFKTLNLEQTEKSVIGTVQKIHITDSILLISDERALFAFDANDGRYLHTFGQRGNGEMEYLNLNTFFVDNKHHVNIVDDVKGRVLTFDINGSFLHSAKWGNDLLRWIQNAEMLNGGDLFCSRYIWNDQNRVYNVIRKDGTTSFSMNTPLRTSNTAERVGVHPFSMYDGKTRFVMPLSPYIYLLDSNKPTAVIEISSGAEPISEDEVKDIKDFNVMTGADLISKGRFQGFTDIFETSGHILLGFHDLYYYLFDKRTHKGKTIQTQATENLSYAPLYRIMGTHGDWLIGVLSGSDFLDAGQKSRFTLGPKAKDSGKRFTETVSKLNAHDNPTLLFYKLKP